MHSIQLFLPVPLKKGEKVILKKKRKKSFFQCFSKNKKFLPFQSTSLIVWIFMDRQGK